MLLRCTSGAEQEPFLTSSEVSKKLCSVWFGFSGAAVII